MLPYLVLQYYYLAEKIVKTTFLRKIVHDDELALPSYRAL